MINGRRVLGIIPARGGSKGVVRKNVRTLGGKPLIAWTIEAAQQSNYLDRLILSSEDNEIIEVTSRCGCEVPFVRPIDLAKDNTPGIMPVLHALRALGEAYDIMVMLQPTSPFRIAADIDMSLEKCLETNAPSCVSVSEVQKSPYWMYTIQDDWRISPLLKQDRLISRRQELPAVGVLNGAVYVADVQWLQVEQAFVSEETVAYLMPAIRSMDIDSEFDFEMCEYLIAKGLV